MENERNFNPLNFNDDTVSYSEIAKELNELICEMEYELMQLTGIKKDEMSKRK